MRVLELFGGYGSQALALENLGIDFKSDLCEIDKYAIQAYNQLHGETYNYGDICKIDETKLPYYDLITYSSPCQDFSVAGKQAGGDKGSGTRSSLLWECERIIRAVKPQYLLMENVKNLVGETHIHNFIAWLRVLEEMGYRSFWKVLNAKDYGVPQNRERVFVVSIRGGGQYQFPEPIKLTKRLKDILEPVVDEKYYLSDKLINGFLNRMDKSDGGFAREINIRDKESYASTLTARMAKCGITDNYIEEPMALDEQNNYIRQDGCVGTIMADGSSPKHNNRVMEPICCSSRGRNPENPSDRTTGSPTEQRLELNETGCTNTLTSVQKDNYVLEPKVMQEPINLYPNSGNPQAGRVYNSKGISPAMDTCSGGNRMPKITEQYRIRKLTPRECWRLMGVRDEQFDKLHDISNSQLYKMAGNSIVVDVLMGIFRNLFIDKDQKGQLQLL